MNISEVWSIAHAVLLSLGGGAAIVLIFSTWLGKVWANRILEREKTELQQSFANFQQGLSKELHKHNVAALRIDTQRVEAIRDLYGVLIAWHEAVIQIVNPNDFNAKPELQTPFVLAKYAGWAEDLKKRSQKLENAIMTSAIYFSEDTYCLIEKCGDEAREMSAEFAVATLEDDDLGSREHLEHVEQARTVLAGKYEENYDPARRAVISVFRGLVDPITTTQ